MAQPQPKTEFKNETSRASLKTNLLDRLEKYNSVYRESAPSPTGKGAPGIPDSGLKNERVAGDYFGYGGAVRKFNEGSTGQIQNRGFVCGKQAMGKSDYEGTENGKSTAADKSIYRNHMKADKYGDSSAISGLAQGLRTNTSASNGQRRGGAGSYE